MKFLFIESFYGGSHKVFCDGLIKNSKYQIDLISLPAKNFKWRIRGSAYYFARHIKNIHEYSGIIVTDMINLSDFKSFFKNDLPPVLFYFHENQMDYPLALKQKIDYQLVFANINSALCADIVCFNSKSHEKSFLDSLTIILKRMPQDDDISWINNNISKKSVVVHPGCDFSFFEKEKCEYKNRKAHILWNHRWDYDKKPELFFKLLKDLKNNNFDFKLIILGEEGPKINLLFEAAEKDFKNEICHLGFVENKDQYFRLIQKSDIVLSTAVQENFGYSIVEAVRGGCIPVLPKRLSYPEIMPLDFHGDIFYKNYKEMFGKFVGYLENSVFLDKNKFGSLFSYMDKYSWKNNIQEYDDILEKLVNLS